MAHSLQIEERRLRKEWWLAVAHSAGSGQLQQSRLPEVIADCQTSLRHRSAAIGHFWSPWDIFVPNQPNALAPTVSAYIVTAAIGYQYW